MSQSPKLSPEPDLVERFSITISKLEDEIELCQEEIALLDPEDDRTSLEEQLGKRLKRLQRLLAQRDEAFEACKTGSNASRKMGNSKRKRSSKPSLASAKSQHSKGQYGFRVEKKKVSTAVFYVLPPDLSA